MKIKLDSFLLSTITTKHIAITGGGGKTSLMIFLSRVLATQNKSVLISTTTKVIRPDKMDYGVEKVFLEPFDYVPIKGEVVFFAIPYSDEKVQGPESRILLKMAEKFDFLIYEADGARKCPIKTAKEWEPVILEDTDNVINLIGIKSLNKKFCEANFYNTDGYVKKFGSPEDNIISKKIIENIVKDAESYSNMTLINQGDILKKEIKIKGAKICSIKENWIDV